VEVEWGDRVVGIGHSVEPQVALAPPEGVIGVPIAVLMDAAQMQEGLGAVNGPTGFVGMC